MAWFWSSSNTNEEEDSEEYEDDEEYETEDEEEEDEEEAEEGDNDDSCDDDDESQEEAQGCKDVVEAGDENDKDVDQGKGVPAKSVEGIAETKKSHEDDQQLEVLKPASTSLLDLETGQIDEEENMTDRTAQSPESSAEVHPHPNQQDSEQQQQQQEEEDTKLLNTNDCVETTTGSMNNEQNQEIYKEKRSSEKLDNASRNERETNQEGEEEEEELEDVAVDSMDEGEPGELVLQGAIPGEVGGNRARATSALTHEEEEKDVEEEEIHSRDEGVEPVTDEEDEEDDNASENKEGQSMEEKQGLLILAAQFDRVDILNRVLNDATERTTLSPKDDNEKTIEKPIDDGMKSTLLHGGLPPLHVAILAGSMNAINCLLRVGADPSIRPKLSQIPPEQLKSIRDAKLVDGVTAWELAFGNGNTKSKLNLPMSKIEGIQHAFCAEALRCIGSDEVDRLKQLLDAGVPTDLEMGGKLLHDWAVEMKANDCVRLLRPEGTTLNGSVATDEGEKESSAVLYRGGNDTVVSLTNRLDELESLARALSACLDNLAEEVSVCHGLLLMGGGASALAAHVRSLKGNKELKMEELDRVREMWENSEDQLAYWVREAGVKGEDIDQIICVSQEQTEVQPCPKAVSNGEDDESLRRQLHAQIAAVETKVRKLRVSITDLGEENTNNLAEVERRGLTGGITLVRKLRDEIRELDFQLSEAKSAEAACQAKVSLIQSRLAGINNKKSNGSSIVNNEITAASSPQSSSEPDVSPTQGKVAPASDTAVATTGEVPTLDASTVPDTTVAATNTSKDEVIDAAASSRELAVQDLRNEVNPVLGDADEGNGAGAICIAGEAAATSMEREIGFVLPPTNGDANHDHLLDSLEQKDAGTESERIATGQSRAIAVRGEGPRGYFTLGLWNILLRIIGIRENATANVTTLVTSATPAKRNPNVPPAVII